MVSHILLGNVALTLFVQFYALVGSIAMDNYSIIDRLWSILPPLYTLWMTEEFSKLLKFPDAVQLWLEYPKLAVMITLPLLWGVRLTYNFARKGGYSLTNEDYRWAWMRENSILKNPIIFQFFNFFFISTFQVVVLQLLTHPMYIVIHTLQIDPANIIGKFTVLDGILTFLFIVLLYIESTADEQQWQFYQYRTQYDNGELVHNASYTGKLWNKTDFGMGFNTKGLFSASRHPNFFAEVSLWFTYSCFTLPYWFLPTQLNGVTLYQPLTNFKLCNIFSFEGVMGLFTHPFAGIAGALLLWSIFMISTPLTEHISSLKYPRYAHYKKNVSRLIPQPIELCKQLWFSLQSDEQDGQ